MDVWMITNEQILTETKINSWIKLYPGSNSISFYIEALSQTHSVHKIREKQGKIKLDSSE